jgi:lambda repressor-like predicted transcriptional regulator
LRAEGASYQDIATRFGVSYTSVQTALSKPANRARIARITAEIEDAAISAARHNVAASVSEKCRLRLSLARNLGIESAESVPRVGIDSSVSIRDYLAVDKALLDQLESYSKRAREANQDERVNDTHELEIRRAKILLEIAEAQKHGDSISDSLQNGGTGAGGDETLPDNRRAY